MASISYQRKIRRMRKGRVRQGHGCMVVVVMILLAIILSCNKYRGYKGYGLKHDVGVSKEKGNFIYAPDTSKIIWINLEPQPYLESNDTITETPTLKFY